ncbi:MAG: long-chain fatty acid--CoA ligase [Catenulispora sp.]|nr:long-chain fatty acid--CoA ligase [Catenulispora sp.]
MRSTMQETPLSISTLLTFGSTVYGASHVHTVTADGLRTATFAELGARAAQLAHALHDDLGVRGDDRVATFMWNNQEHLEAYFAVPSMGAVLHTLNIRLYPDQVTYIAGHAADKVVLVDGSLIPLLARVLPGFTTVEHVVVVGEGDPAPLAAAGKTVHRYEELLAGKPTAYAWPAVEETDAAAMCYTSGTTGNPKGVVYSHRSIYLHSMQVAMPQSFGLTEANRILTIVPMFHAMAWGIPYAALLTGATLVMPDRFLQAAALVRAIEQSGADFAGAVPTIWNDVLHHLDAAGGDISTLKRAVVGGSAVPPALMTAFEERYGMRIIHAWGMTETSPLGCVSHPPAGTSGQEAFAYRVTQGRFPAGVQARLAGPDGTIVPSDGEAVGELEVRGPWITGSYYRDEDPERFHDGWLRTGDVGTITANGYLTLTDRAKDVIKSGGEWISSVELENHLMAHPAVAEATVVAVPDPRWQERPLAAVVLHEGRETTPDELREYLAGLIPKWQLPERWTYLKEVPKTSVGKFDKKAVRRAYADGELEVTVL